MKISRKKLFGFLLFGMLILSFGFSFANASSEFDEELSLMEEEDDDNEEIEDDDEEETEDEDEDDDDVNDDFEEENKREVEIEVSDNEVQIETVKKNGENKDKMKIKIELEDEGISIKLTYESEYEVTVTENETEEEFEAESEIQFKIKFRKIIEYIDSNGNEQYDKSTDIEIQEYIISNFQPIGYSTSTVENATLHYLNVSTTDGVFTTHIYVTEEFTRIGNTIVTPAETKIDIEIKDFPFLNISSRLALYTKLESETEYEEESETEDEKNGYAVEEHGVGTMANGFNGFFTWADEALIDGVVKNVTVSSLEKDDDDEENEKFYFNYPQGSIIFHDPKIGVEGLLLSVATPAIPGFNLLIVGVVGITAVALIMGLMKRKRSIK